jgi:hypothetical protein
MPPSRVCDIESLITLSPSAVIFLFRSLVGACTLQVKGAEMLGNRVLWGISTYLAGLIILDEREQQLESLGSSGLSAMTSCGVWPSCLVTSDWQ